MSLLIIAIKKLTLLFLLCWLWLLLSYLRDPSILTIILEWFATFLGNLCVHLHIFMILVLCKNYVPPLVLIIFIILTFSILEDVGKCFQGHMLLEYYHFLMFKILPSPSFCSSMGTSWCKSPYWCSKPQFIRHQ